MSLFFVTLTVLLLACGSFALAVMDCDTDDDGVCDPFDQCLGDDSLGDDDGDGVCNLCDVDVDFGDTGADIDINIAGGGKLGGLAFLTSDFTGTGDASLTEGIRINANTSGFADITAVGIGANVVPEPSTLALLLAAAPLFWFRRRWMQG